MIVNNNNVRVGGGNRGRHIVGGQNAQVGDGQIELDRLAEIGIMVVVAAQGIVDGEGRHREVGTRCRDHLDRVQDGFTVLFCNDDVNIARDGQRIKCQYSLAE